MSVLRSILAQASVEARLRLRSPATAIAIVLLGAGAVLWIPDPSGRAASLSWRGADGTVFSSVYSSQYLSWATAIVGGILSIVGFYLVAGSIRRDRERGVGAILAATPLSGPAYLAGKFTAHVAYLGLLSTLAVGAGVVAFVRWGSGSFHPADFLFAWLLFVLPGVACTAALAVFFDVAPVLRGRAGLVIWFFAFAALASGFTPRGKDGRLERLPRFDPFGMATLQRLVEESVPQATGVSSGLIFHDKPLMRVDWPGVTVTTAVLGQRLTSLLAALLPLAAAALFFDRFDPARARRFRRSRGKGSADAGAAFETLPDAPVFAPGPAHPRARRRPLRSILAESRLTWDAASLLKWPLLRKLVEERKPATIAVDISLTHAFSDGLTAGEREKLESALGPWTAKLVRGEGPAPSSTSPCACPRCCPPIGHTGCRSCTPSSAAPSRSEVITPGTTTEDVVWWMRQR